MVRGGAWLRWRLGPGPGGGGILAILCALIMARPRAGGALAIICAMVMARPIGGNTNLHLPISQMCPSDVKGSGGHFMSKIPQTIDGAVVVSTDERDVSCIIAFQTESILEKFLLRFERLHVDCNDHLYIFDGAHATGSPRAHISCDDSRDKVGPNGLIITRTNFVTLKYETDSWGTENNGFELVITAFKNAHQSGCRESFQCNNYVCINQDLVCDGIQHCPHGQDENSANHCAGGGLSSLLGLEMTQLVGVASLVAILLLGGGVAAWIWSCRRERERQVRRDLIANSYQMREKADGDIPLGDGRNGLGGRNGSGPGGGPQTNPRNGVTTVAVATHGSGNLLLPALGRGFKLCGLTLSSLLAA